MVRIAEILPGSIAEELRLRIGSRIVRINGEPVRDVIDFRFLEADGRLEVEVGDEAGDLVLYDIEKDAGEGLGVVPAPDAVRECANKCVFCFIDGNPPDVRDSLWLRDDDFRLSFTYGSYVTLTNLGPKGFQRLIDQKLSPLYVSVHATEPEVRMRLLGVPRGGEIVDQLRQLTDAGIEVHTQIVLCPEWNDGAHLERTLADLRALGPRILSISVVPVGLTRYNLERPVRLMDRLGGHLVQGHVDAVGTIDEVRGITDRKSASIDSLTASIQCDLSGSQGLVHVRISVMLSDALFRIVNTAGGPTAPETSFGQVVGFSDIAYTWSLDNYRYLWDDFVGTPLMQASTTQKISSLRPSPSRSPKASPTPTPTASSTATSSRATCS